MYGGSALLTRLKIRRKRSETIALAMLALSLPTFAQSGSVNIVSPSDGTAILAGQPITVSVAVSGVAGLQGVQVLSPAFGITNVATQPPFGFTVTFPSDALGSQQLTAVAFTGSGEGIFSGTIAVSVVPPTSLASVSTNVSSILLSFLGETARIRATGRFVNGGSVDITGLSSTKFSSQDSVIAKVDAAGNVVGTGSGETTITVRNGSLSATVAVSVLATIRGDLNGDGKVDQDDFNLLLAAVGTPVTGPFDARDLNGDGVIDNKDVEILRAACTSACVPGGHIVPITGVANAASFVANSVSPGALFSVFTSGLAVPTISATTVPFSNSLGGVTVQVGGTAIPLLYVSPTQINAQMPYEIAPGPTTLSVMVNGSSSVAIPLTVAPTAPGLFMFQDGRAIVQNQDYSINSGTNPANAGSVIVAYFTGQGALDRSISSGDAAPLADLSRPTSATSATVGGLSAQVLFSGMTPTFVGLAQANIVIPNVPSGDYPLVITVGEAVSNAGLVSVHAQ
jgi:uncharacterized protein (TIGR03437 family)